MHVVTAGLVYIYSADSGVIMTSSLYSDMFEFTQSGSKSWAQCEKKNIYKNAFTMCGIKWYHAEQINDSPGRLRVNTTCRVMKFCKHLMEAACLLLASPL